MGGMAGRERFGGGSVLFACFAAKVQGTEEREEERGVEKRGSVANHK